MDRIIDIDMNSSMITKSSTVTKSSTITKLCEDTVGHVLSFLDDEDKIELCYTNRAIQKSIRIHTKMNPFHKACQTCYHPPLHCRCDAHDKLIGSCIFGLLILIIGITILFTILSNKKAI